MKTFPRLLALLALIFAATPVLAQTTPYTTFIQGAPVLSQPNGTEPVSIISGGVTNQVSSIVAANPMSVVVTAPPYNASGFIVQTLTSGTVASGTTNIPVVSSAGFYPNQIVIVALAGTSALKNFAGTISAIPDSTHITVASSAVTGNLLPPTATSGASGTQATSIPAGYTVYSVGTTTTGTTVSNGATVLALANAGSYQKGQGIFVYGCAAAGANLITQITNVATNAVTISPAVSNASGCPSGTAVQHDDTTALQTALNLVTVNKSVKMIYPDGAYQVNGNSQGGTANAILQFPNINYYNSGATFWGAQTTLEMTGMTAAPQMQTYLQQSAIAHTAGAMIWTNAGGGVNLFGAFYSGQYQNFTNIQLIVRNLTFRSYPNPNVTMINAGAVESLKLYDSDFDTGETGQITQPTHATFATVFPLQGNGGNHLALNVEYNGYYYGMSVGEHMNMQSIRFDAVFIPVFFNQGGGYGTTGKDVECNGCPHCLYMGAQTYHPIPIDFPQLNVEHQCSPAWICNSDDIYDPNSYFTGRVSMDVYNGGSISINKALQLQVINLNNQTGYPFAATNNAGLGGSHFSGAGNGTTVFCTDCTKTTPCAGSGTGALAKMLNGAWDCN